MENPSVDELDLCHLEDEKGTEVRAMLRKYESMWDGSLSEINTVKHHLGLNLKAWTFISRPYRAGPN